MDHLLLQVVPLTLIAFRLSGLFVFAPMLAGVSVPVKVRVLLCFITAVAMVGLARPTMPGSIPGDAVSFCFLAAGEAVIGLVIGLLALLPVIAVQLGGTIMSQQMGLSLATVYDPSTESDTDVVAGLLLQGAMVIFVLLGGLEVLFIAVARSFSTVPLGGVVIEAHASSALKLITGLLGSGFELALRVSTPVLGIILVETLASSMIMKTVPQMNIMSIGFGVKVLLGLGALILALHSIDEAVGGHILDAGRQILNWPQAIAAPGAEVGGVTHG
ncbi:MAG: flagellar biosynthetic protein FliR [Phycisphaerales bacterium]